VRRRDARPHAVRVRRCLELAEHGRKRLFREGTPSLRGRHGKNQMKEKSALGSREEGLSALFCLVDVGRGGAWAQVPSKLAGKGASSAFTTSKVPNSTLRC
jgi:hypothetical protein